MPFAAVTLCLLAGQEGARSLSSLPPSLLQPDFVCGGFVLVGKKQRRAACEGSLGREKAGAASEFP